VVLMDGRPEAWITKRKVIYEVGKITYRWWRSW
jgi:hypothetical protein